MSKGKKVKAGKRAAKIVNKALEQKLQDALSDWKEKLGEKKFARRVKKAAKAFGKDLKVIAIKKVKPTKKTDSNKNPVTAKSKETASVNGVL